MSKSELTPWDALVTHIHDSGVAWVEANLKASQLEELDRKPLLADIMNGYEASTKDKISEAKLERMALGTRTYRDYIAGMCLARAEALKAKVVYESYLNLFEAKRTEAATERVKIDRGIFDRGKG